ncbi:MAG: histidine phosphatase family protein [Brucellaceae bacterium]|nr:histidine phosphatase family protein [Brucellaceae bacterium]
MLPLALAFVAALASPAGATDAAWSKLRDGGYTILIAHAEARGNQDPPGFRIDDCATQRRLTDRGRQHAQRMGARFAARAVAISRVLSSQWCIALDTARFAFERNEAEAFAPLDPADGSDGADANADVVAAVAGFADYGNQVMVTHVPNIVALTGVRPRDSEALVVVPGDDATHLRVVGRIISD